MFIGGREITEDEQENYEVAINRSTGKVIGLQKKEVSADESEHSDNPVLHRYA